MPVVNHIHTYVKYKGRPGFYRCNAPDCTHFIDKESITGKISLCSLCGEQMILNREALRRAKPRCINCSDTKKSRAHKRAQEITRGLGTDFFSDPFGGPKQLELEEPQEEEEELNE